MDQLPNFSNHMRAIFGEQSTDQELLDRQATPDQLRDMVRDVFGSDVLPLIFTTEDGFHLIQFQIPGQFELKQILGLMFQEMYDEFIQLRESNRLIQEEQNTKIVLPEDPSIQ